MTDTDRKKIKDQQVGEYVTAKDIVDATTEVGKIHRRTFFRARPYAANDTAVWTAGMGTVQRKSRLKAFNCETTTTIANDNSNYVKFTLSWQYPNGGTGATLGSYNSHTGAQGVLTANVTGAASIVSNSDADIPAGSKLRLAQSIAGTGQNVVVVDTSFTVDVEEI